MCDQCVCFVFFNDSGWVLFYSSIFVVYSSSSSSCLCWGHGKRQAGLTAAATVVLSFSYALNNAVPVGFLKPPSAQMPLVHNYMRPVKEYYRYGYNGIHKYRYYRHIHVFPTQTSKNISMKPCGNRIFTFWESLVFPVISLRLTHQQQESFNSSKTGNI